MAKKAKQVKKKKPPVGHRARPAAAAKPARPRQADLPGTEDRAIKPLEDGAEAYADIRDQRMQLSKDESSLKQSLIRLMKRHGKTHYKRNGVSIDLISEAESIRVRFKKPGDEEADLPPGEDGDEQDADDEGEAGDGAEATD